MKHALLNIVFRIAEVALQIGATFVVYVAVLRTMESMQQYDQSPHVVEAIVLVSLPLLMAWKSKGIASAIVDIVRKPLLESEKRP